MHPFVSVKAVSISLFQCGAWLPASGGAGDASVEGPGAAGVGAELSSAGLSSSAPAGLSTGPPDGQEEPQEVLLVPVNSLIGLWCELILWFNLFRGTSFAWLRAFVFVFLRLMELKAARFDISDF